MDLQSGVLERVTNQSKSSVSSGPWSPDSLQTAINWSLARGAAIMTLPYGNPKPLGDAMYVEDWSLNGKRLLCRDGMGGRVMVVPANGGPPRTIHTSPYFTVDLRLSPDEKFVAYTSVETGREEIEIASYPSFADKRPVSTEGGTYPTWRMDGKELFFLAESGKLMSAEIERAGMLKVSAPKPVFRAAGLGVPPYGYAPTGDGKRFLIIEGQPTQPAQNVVLMNWTAGLKQ
jgi:Tol biopolymer transport system component